MFIDICIGRSCVAGQGFQINYPLTLLVKRETERVERRDGVKGKKTWRSRDVSNRSLLLSREWKSCWHQHEYFSREIQLCLSISISLSLLRLLSHSTLILSSLLLNCPSPLLHSL